MSVNVTAHVVQATCPFCGGQVRNSLELRDALLELAAFVAEAPTPPLREKNRDVYRERVVAAAGHLDELRAELCGQHLRCGRPDGNSGLTAAERAS